MKIFMTAIIALGLAGTAASETSPAPKPWNVTDGAVIDFTVLRKGKPFGQHVLSFDKTEDGQIKVTTDVDLTVKFGPITAFKYRLDAQETWANGALIALNGATNNDGDKSTVEAKVNGDVLEVDGTDYQGNVEASIIPSSHWNRLQVYGEQMLSTESGEILDIAVENLGADTVLVGGEPVEATHYRLQSDMTVDLWYDDQSRWVKLTFDARGQTIEYVLNALY
ncbi:MAG: hypothetical protein Hens3KO_12250 [Henriciella sp.]